MTLKSIFEEAVRQVLNAKANGASDEDAIMLGTILFTGGVAQLLQ
jgi:hypothetical protein